MYFFFQKKKSSDIRPASGTSKMTKLLEANQMTTELYQTLDKLPKLEVE